MLGVHAVRPSVEFRSEMSSWDMKGRIWLPLPVGHRWSVSVTSPSPPACAYVREERFLQELCAVVSDVSAGRKMRNPGQNAGEVLSAYPERKLVCTS